MEKPNLFGKQGTSHLNLFITFLTLACLFSLVNNSDKNDEVKQLTTENKNYKQALTKIATRNKEIIEEQKLLAMQLQQLNENGATLTLSTLLSSNVNEAIVKNLMSDARAENVFAAESVAIHEETLVGDDQLSAMGTIKVMEGNYERLSSVLGITNDSLIRWSRVLSAVPSIKPTSGWISSDFGSRKSSILGRVARHYGIDIAGRVGTAILATADGKIGNAGQSYSFGRFVEIDHENGIATLYAHAGSLFVARGDRVRRGQRIAEIGLTGRTTGAHLHYEVRIDRRPVDPAMFFEVAFRQVRDSSALLAKHFSQGPAGLRQRPLLLTERDRNKGYTGELKLKDSKSARTLWGYSLAMPAWIIITLAFLLICIRQISMWMNRLTEASVEVMHTHSSKALAMVRINANGNEPAEYWK